MWGHSQKQFEGHWWPREHYSWLAPALISVWEGEFAWEALKMNFENFLCFFNLVEEQGKIFKLSNIGKFIFIFLLSGSLVFNTYHIHLRSHITFLYLFSLNEFLQSFYLSINNSVLRLDFF